MFERLQRCEVFTASFKYNVLVSWLSSLMDDDANKSNLQARAHSWNCGSARINWRKLVALHWHELVDVRGNFLFYLLALEVPSSDYSAITLFQ